MEPDASSDVLPWSQQLVNPKVRRWDQTDNKDLDLVQGAVPVKEGQDAWINLEDGVQIAFSPDGEYRTGDYWLIPVRVATGELEWPVSATGPVALPPDGIEHHYAPLGFVWKRAGELIQEPCHCEFEPLSSCFQMGSMAVGVHLLRSANSVVRPVADEPAAPPKPETPRRKRRK
jgi:hypothetical protein